LRADLTDFTDSKDLAGLADLAAGALLMSTVWTAQECGRGRGEKERRAGGTVCK
jgi:hypothetical protein